MPPRQEGLPTLFSSDLFQVFTFILLFIALLYGQHGLVLLSLLILIMFNGARIWGRFSLGGLSCRLLLGRERLFPGEATILEAQVTNNKFLPVWLQLAVIVDRLLTASDSAAAALPDPQPSAASFPAAPVSSADNPPTVYTGEGFYLLLPNKELLWGEGGLLWQQESCWRWELTAQRRGVYEAGPLRLAAGDLFGFYRREKEFSPKCPVIVYPRLVSLNMLEAPLRELFGVPGIKSPVVDPVYPIATRDYQEGRPARHIHWKTSARHGRLQEKVFEPSAQQKIMLAVDVEQFYREKADAAFERTLEVAASLAVALEQQGRAFGMVSNGILDGPKGLGLPALLPPGGGCNQLLHLLELLARLQPKPRHDLAAALLAGAGAVNLHGVTCLLFAYDPAEMNDNVREYFNRLQVPVIHIGSSPAACRGGGYYSLDALLVKEAAG